MSSRAWRASLLLRCIAEAGTSNSPTVAQPGSGTRSGPAPPFAPARSSLQDASAYMGGHERKDRAVPAGED